MRILCLALSSMLCTTSIYAGSLSYLNESLNHIFNNQAQLRNSFELSMIYGGKDFSHPKIATADEDATPTNIILAHRRPVV